MAKEAKPAKAEEAPVAPKKKNKKLLIIILAAVLTIVLIGGGATLYLIKKHAAEQADDEDSEETAKPNKKDKKSDSHEEHPVFVALDPFTVNLIPETGDQYLQVTISVEIEDPLAEAPIKTNMPKIRNNLTLLLSSNKASQLISREGKERLANELKTAINETLEPPKKSKKAAAEDGPVKSVLFTSFIIQ